jgi:hypothetical protein
LNNENYVRDPRKGLVKALLAADWINRPIGHDDFWQKGSYRILIDSIGVFLFQSKDGRWTRTHGLSYNLIFHKHLANNCLYFHNFLFNLVDGG